MALTPRSIKRAQVLQDRRNSRSDRKSARQRAKARANDPRHISAEKIYADVMAQLNAL
jgi:hypothetical protein